MPISEIAAFLRLLPEARAARLFLHVLPWGICAEEIPAAQIERLFECLDGLDRSQESELFARAASVRARAGDFQTIMEAVPPDFAAHQQLAEAVFAPLLVPFLPLTRERAFPPPTPEAAETKAEIRADVLPLERRPLVILETFLDCLPVSSAQEIRVHLNLPSSSALAVHEFAYRAQVLVSGLGRLIGRGQVDIEDGCRMAEAEADELDVNWESIAMELRIWIGLEVRKIYACQVPRN